MTRERFLDAGCRLQNEPGEEACRRPEEALARVELFLGVGVEEARDIVCKVLEDVS